MRFYTLQHRHYCGIDLHVKTMYVCILDGAGQMLVHRNLKATPDAFLFRPTQDCVAASRDTNPFFVRMRDSRSPIAACTRAAGPVAELYDA